VPYGQTLIMERRSRYRAIPLRTLAIVVGSAISIGVASLIFLWPTVRGLFPAAVHHTPTAAVYATYEVVAVSANAAYLLVRPPGAVLSASLYRTRDAGATWQRLSLPASASGNGFVLRSLSGGNLFLRTFTFATGSQHFYVGDGSTWIEIAVPEHGSGSLQMVDAKVGFYVATQTAGTPSVQELVVYRTQDGGRTWEQRLDLNTFRSTSGGLNLSDVNSFMSFADSLHGWLVVVPSSWGLVCGIPRPTDPAQQLMTSQDGGSTWTPVSLPRLPQGSTQLGTPVFPGSGGGGYLTITANTYVGQCPPVGTTLAYGTLDDGTTWSGPRTLPGPFFDSPDGVVWWASDGRQLFRSNNQGQNWETTEPHLPAGAVTLEALFVVNAQTAWSLWSAGSDQAQPQRERLLRTTDAGAHWSEVRLPGG
jgi:photosystem II stability/assembly factor-like uncharacterized protein